MDLSKEKLVSPAATAMKTRPVPPSFDDPPRVVKSELRGFLCAMAIMGGVITIIVRSTLPTYQYVKQQYQVVSIFQCAEDTCVAMLDDRTMQEVSKSVSILDHIDRCVRYVVNTNTGILAKYGQYVDISKCKE